MENERGIENERGVENDQYLYLNMSTIISDAVQENPQATTQTGEGGWKGLKEGFGRGVIVVVILFLFFGTT